ncbi:hypothetical protein WJX74_006201 [Apatococcus lobatus]|uniref:Hedgehog protein Hint domain-containing protein n=1 Tax=Apatococcus lobatus TaxID=904363 RepID=A0AAW1PR86_9CHLO
MDKLQLGDLVMTSAGFEAIFLFGERDSSRLAPFIVIETGAHKIEMSADHFIHVQSLGLEQFKRAGQVSTGDFIWVKSEGQLKPSAVTAVSSVVQVGLYNPYTPSGSIFVNGVLASVHSRWFLDDACDLLGCVAHLPTLYQAAMLPIRFICFLVTLIGGPGAVEAVDNLFSLTYIGHTYPQVAAASYAASTSAAILLTAVAFRKLAN